MTVSLVLLVVLLVLPVVLLLAFAGCGFDGQATGVAPIGTVQGPPLGTGPSPGPPTGGGPVLPAAKPYSQVIRAEGVLVGYWRLGEPKGAKVAVDSGPLKRDGTYSNTGVTLGITGAVTPRPPSLTGETAVDFDGKSGFVEVPYDARLNPPMNFSIEAWVRPAASPAGHQDHTVLSSHQQRGNRKLGFELSVVRAPAQAGIRARVGTGGPTDLDLFAPHPWPASDWVHVVLVCDVQSLQGPRALKLYVDAKTPPAAVPMTTYEAVSASPLRIGAGPGDANQPPDFFAGGLDEVAIYGAALSATQVDQHFKAR